jgi:uncharacterized coiled-coil protein SlyX
LPKLIYQTVLGLTPDDTQNFTSRTRDLSFYGSKALAHVRLDYVAYCNDSIVNIELQRQNKTSNIPRFFTYNYLLRQRYLTDHGIEDYISLPIVSILLCNYNIALNKQFITEFPYSSGNELQKKINQTIMRMFFVNINLIPKKPFAKLTPFEQVCCFFKAETWEDLNFLSRNGGFMVEKAVKCYNEVIEDPMFILERNEFDLDFRNMVNEEVEVRTKPLELEILKREDALIKNQEELDKNKEELLKKDNELAIKNSELADKVNRLAEKDNRLAEQDNRLAEQEKTIKQLTKQITELKAVMVSQENVYMSEFSDLKEMLHRLTNNK